MSDEEGYQEPAAVEEEWMHANRRQRKRARHQITEEQNAALEDALKKCTVASCQDWMETLAFTAPAPTEIQDIENDKERELVFCKQALEAAIDVCERLKEASVNYRRPDDYFAEMVKSDAHMLKIQERLAEEKQKASASEDAKRNREMRKFGKQVQQAKLKERKEEKKRALSDVKKWRKQHAKGEDFPVDLAEDEASSGTRGAKRGREGASGGAEGPSGKRSKREQHEAKYKYQGRKTKGWRGNDRESYSAVGKALHKSLPREMADDEPARGGRGKGAERKGPAKRSASAKSRKAQPATSPAAPHEIGTGSYEGLVDGDETERLAAQATTATSPSAWRASCRA
eukprot:m51a1_g12889 hypothetical protein (343) ;mRNA; f:528-3216